MSLFKTIPTVLAAAVCVLGVVWTVYHVDKAVNLRAAVDVALEASAPEAIAIERLEPEQFDPAFEEVAVTQIDEFYTGTLADRRSLLLLTTDAEPGAYVAFTTLISDADNIDAIFDRLAVEGRAGVVSGVIDDNGVAERHVRELLEQEGLMPPTRLIMAEPFFGDRVTELQQIRDEAYLNPLIALVVTLLAALTGWFNWRKLQRNRSRAVAKAKAAADNAARNPASMDDPSSLSPYQRPPG
jgi:hypothetical protein